jgi:hypothetical protein
MQELDLDLQLDDVVLFELPNPDDVEAFRSRIRPRWEGWSDADGDLWLFTAQLEQSRDLAPLLREAQALVSDLGLDAIRFCLDGRIYVLDAARSEQAVGIAA